ncbi:FAD-dependent oxidoreductase [Agrobacterium tumefaciens]|uniref:FAD-dependent oxidoreductase n=1 Tax=Agrobacterium tumefaciens TaxID=358 RepID=A0AAP9J9M2_AGRTU|nr:FAD-dependent oxidoreductase [Agrobacterium tumefaciens]NSZ60145.1 FAD-dependent oxidoreductase [Agrobacterium tumefaciens]QDY97740.1 FAD-dependent oxidoreductase [Agrobacterium tumefaciens]UXS12863.1 FAD-dependent oxidoreductase [Agrobacterium tumefaciens]UXS20225.1 FAD-dependent oxidoreductase [Agrobacterium tumefaciens]UXS27871.1 FAD-dependent oxidoreductase [Agrobacterium tumefaciens]
MTAGTGIRRLDAVGAIEARYDLVIIGAGPAGMSAAIMAAGHGLSVLVADRSREEGGQIYRGVATVPKNRARLLGSDYEKGAGLAAEFRETPCDYLPNATVWFLDGTPQIGLSAAGESRMVSCRHVILATGAMERPMPVSGWTLPGVMTVGAAQILLKGHGVVADGRVVLAGCGPLLWLVASQYIAAGHPPALVVDTTARGNLLRALMLLPGFLLSQFAGKGLSLIARVHCAVPVVRAAELLSIKAENERRVLRYRRGNRSFETDFDYLFLHQGLVPDIQLAAAAGVRHAWSSKRAVFEPALDAWGVSNLEAISVVGDGAAVAGAKSARHAGALAALEACHRLGCIDSKTRDQLGRPHRRGRHAARRGRALLDRLYLPTPRQRQGDGATILCRCEEITADQLRDTLSQLPVRGPNQLKAFLRCGMGPCQGRQCGLAVSESIADHLNASMDVTGYYRLRPPVFPISLSEIAGLDL